MNNWEENTRSEAINESLILFNECGPFVSPDRVREEVYGIPNLEPTIFLITRYQKPFGFEATNNL